MSTPVVRQQKTRTRNARRGSRNRGSLPVTSSLRKLWDSSRRDVKYLRRAACLCGGFLTCPRESIGGCISCSDLLRPFRAVAFYSCRQSQGGALGWLISALQADARPERPVIIKPRATPWESDQ